MPYPRSRTSLRRRRLGLLALLGASCTVGLASSAEGNTTADPIITIGDVAVVEGDAGTVNATITLTRSALSLGTVSVDYRTADGTAVAPDDYVASAGTVTFAAASLTRTFTIPVRGDTLDEENERFFVRLLNPVNATLGDDRGRVTINDDDAPAAVLSIAGTSVIEGTGSGTTVARFKVTSSAPSGRDINVNYETLPLTANPSDYGSNSGSIALAAGATEGFIEIPITRDTIDEDAETFRVRLTSAMNAAVSAAPGASAAVGTIQDDDTATASVVPVDPQPVPETNAGTNDANFEIRLDAPAERQIVVEYSTTSGLVTPAATAGTDYVAVPTASVTFLPGEVAKTISVQVKGDTIVEFNEKFSVVIKPQTGGIDPPKIDASRKSATATIQDDDTPLASIRPQNQDIDEEAAVSGTTPATFRVRIEGGVPAERPITVNYATADGTAVAPGDYTSKTGSATIAAGQTQSPQFQVLVKNDLFAENPETFTVTITAPANDPGIIDPDHPTATVTINSTDNAAISIVAVGQPVLESAAGAGGTTLANFDIKLNSPAVSPVTVDYSIADGTIPQFNATASEPNPDYVAKTATVNFAVGESTMRITVTVKGDEIDENDETFTVTLSGNTGASQLDPSQTTAEATIQDDDTAIVSIANPNPTPVPEGDSATTPVTFTISLNRAAQRTIAVDYATVDGVGPGGAVAPDDYVPKASSVSFAPGVTSLQGSVEVNGDQLHELNETFRVELRNSGSNADDATISTTARSVVVTIAEDNDLPTINVVAVRTTVREGDPGVPEYPNRARFRVTVTGETAIPVAVRYFTRGGTARVGDDYEETKGFLRFPANDAGGTVTRRVAVEVIPDELPEGPETFRLHVAGGPPGSVIVGTGVAQVTILDDDPQPPPPPPYGPLAPPVPDPPQPWGWAIGYSGDGPRAVAPPNIRRVAVYRANEVTVSHVRPGRQFGSGDWA